ncbi:MAG: M23 family metallopeptidase [Acidobacteriales bacterium]|nr:M23 family metallopeptidase [Terriglobales bacterium]
MGRARLLLASPPLAGKHARDAAEGAAQPLESLRVRLYPAGPGRPALSRRSLPGSALYGYGAPIFAPGPGTVISSANDVADNWYEGHDVKHPVGDDHNGLDNHVIIDHGDGEYSLLCHMKPGTVRVKTGDRVKRGQQLGQIGFSGDSFLPHLHYTLMSGPKQFSSEAEGLPSYFHKVRRVLGSNAREVSGKIDSGDIVESAR